jgi:hypothetical protein
MSLKINARTLVLTALSLTDSLHYHLFQQQSTKMWQEM